MSENTPKKETTQEMDLAQLFQMIGNAFLFLFSLIGKILKVLYGALLSTLIILRRHFLKLVLVLLIGFVVGYIWDSNKQTMYGAVMTVEPNFDSSRQLYNNIEYYNTLTKSRDSITLSEVFGVTPKEAASLTGFYIKPNDNETNRIVRYSRVFKELDSVSQRELSFERFNQSIDNTEYDLHLIGVNSSNSTIFRKIQQPIVESIRSNKYFQQQRDIALKNLNRSDSLINISLRETDSLKNIYLDLKKAEVSKDNPSGTSIVMAQKQENNVELSLLERKLALKDQLNENELLRIENSEIIKVITDFPDVGYVETGFFTQFKFILPSAGILLLLIALGLLKLNEFLIKKEQEIINKQSNG